MDISIEMKNQLRLGRNVLDVFEIIDPVMNRDVCFNYFLYIKYAALMIIIE